MTNVEFRISRHATYDNSQLPVFATNMIAIILEAENAGFDTRDTAPDTGGYVYTFSAPGQLGPLSIAPNQGQVIISWSGPGKLQSRQSLTAGSWQDVQNAANPYMVQPATIQGYYRLSQ